MVAHDNGQICKWAEYASMESIARPKKKIKGAAPTHIKCPSCGDEGRLNWAYDKNATKGERPFTFKYVVVHEKIPGTWGKIKVKRRRRCQRFTPEQRISILKQIGRYITDPPTADRKQIDIPQKALGSTVEPVLQIQNGVKTKENFKGQVKRENRGLIKYEGPIYVPRGKRLTTCTRCNKPGYKYKTYIQHSNEPPTGPRKLGGTQVGWTYRRCSLTNRKVKQEQDNKLNLQHVKSVREYPTEYTLMKSKLKRKGLARYIEPELKAHQTVKRKIPGNKANPNRNILCSSCGKLGTLRPFGGVRYYFAHSSDPHDRCYIKSSNIEQIAYCREQDRKHQEKLIAESSKFRKLT